MSLESEPEGHAPVDYAAWLSAAVKQLGEGGLVHETLEGVNVHAFPGAMPSESPSPPAESPSPASARRAGVLGTAPFRRGAPSGPRVAQRFERPVGVQSLRARAERALGEGAEAVFIGAEIADALDREALAHLSELEALVFDLGSSVAPLAALGAERLRFDPLASLARRGRFAGSKSAIWAQVAALAHAARASGARALLVSTPVVAHEAGARAADEIALALAGGLELIRALDAGEYPLADAPTRMGFAFALDADPFMGVAKLRAARLVWAKVLRALGIDGPSARMHIEARQSRRAMARLDMRSNLLRATTAGFAAFVGGADWASTEPYDTFEAEPGPHAERMARNALLVLREEGALARVADPAGGSRSIEALTDALAREGWATFQEIEHLGGLWRGLSDGSIAERVAEARAAREQALRSRARVVVGVSRYPAAEPVPPATESPGDDEPQPSLEPDAALVEASKAGARALAEALVHTSAALPAAAAALGGQAETVGVALESFREAEAFERTRARVEARPEARKISILRVGAGREASARAERGRALAALLGFSASVASTDDASPITWLACDDAGLGGPPPALISELAASERRVFVLDEPEQAEAWLLAGVEDLIAVDTDVLALADRLLAPPRLERASAEVPPEEPDDAAPADEFDAAAAPDDAERDSAEGESREDAGESKSPAEVEDER